MENEIKYAFDLYINLNCKDRSASLADIGLRIKQ